MAIPIKTAEEINIMREGGKILAETLEKTLELAKPGISTLELDSYAEKYIHQRGGMPGFKGYKGFPSTLCTGINEVIVHGIPKEDEILKEGDILTIDCGVLYKGLYTDAARTIPIGNISNEKEKLLKTAKETLKRAITTAKPGIQVNEIGRIIQKTVEKAGFHIIYDLTGHGVGRNLHEEPIILNFWENKPSAILKPGMTIAIEPIFSIGTSKMKTLKDQWTLVTIDKSCAVQVEETILITDYGNEILTKI